MDSSDLFHELFVYLCKILIDAFPFCIFIKISVQKLQLPSYFMERIQ